jgi:L-asparaginase
VTSAIAVYFLGGTISMTADPGSDRTSAGAVARLDGSALIAAVPQLDGLDVRLEVHDVQAVPSAALTFDDIAAVVAAANRSGVDGIVVVQGTDTIEESAYLIDLLWDRDAPIVVTGAMRTPSAAGADGPANLLAAVTVAAGAQFRGMGALVVFADQVHAARWVRKTHTTSVAAFASPDAGPVGLLVEGTAVVVGVATCGVCAGGSIQRSCTRLRRRYGRRWRIAGRCCAV